VPALFELIEESLTGLENQVADRFVAKTPESQKNKKTFAWEVFFSTIKHPL